MPEEYPEDKPDLKELQGRIPDSEEELDGINHWIRRALVLREWEEVGHLDLVNQTEIANLCGVASATVNQDLQEWVIPYREANVGKHHKAKTEVGFEAAEHKLFSKGEEYKAAKVISKRNKWLEDRGIVDKEPEKVEIDHQVEAPELEEALEDVF